MPGAFPPAAPRPVRSGAPACPAAGRPRQGGPAVDEQGALLVGASHNCHSAGSARSCKAMTLSTSLQLGHGVVLWHG